MDINNDCRLFSRNLKRLFLLASHPPTYTLCTFLHSIIATKLTWSPNKDYLLDQGR